MNSQFAKRRAFLAGRKNQGRRVTIGFTGVADLRSFIGQEYIGGMVKAAEDYDINFINMGSAKNYSVFEDTDFTSYYKKNFSFMKPPLLDGLVTWASSLGLFMDKERVVQTFMDLRPLPMVDIGGLDLPGISSVRVDNDTAIDEIVGHLTNVHHYTKMAFIGYENSAPSKRRLASFQKALKEKGLPELEYSVYMVKTPSVAHTAEVVNELCQHHDLHDKKEIEVIITTSDILAAEIMEQLEKRKIYVPKDLAITGYNNWYEGISARCPMTTISLESFRRGYTAVEMLIDKIIEPDSPPQHVLLPTALIVRQSCGCLEHPIMQSGQSLLPELAAEENACESEEALRRVFYSRLMVFSPLLSGDSVNECINAVFSDLYDEGEPDALLMWFRNRLQNIRKENHFDSDLLENAVTEIRLLTLPLIQDNPSAVIRMENIFHQMRTLISIYLKYEIVQAREDPYQMNNISRIAIRFDEAKSVEDVFEVLKVQMGELGVPWAVLALADQISHGMSPTHIAFEYPEKSETAGTDAEEKILEPHLFPLTALPQKKRYSLMLEVLHHGGRFFGYTFLEIKSLNMAIYDVIRMLLSSALDSVYPKQALSNRTSYAITDSQLNDVVPLSPSSNPNRRTRITTEKITGYLTRHLGEMTDISRMAEHFMVSKSFLSKKTRELTGLSVQTLHEKLKIEQAKNMLLIDSFSLSAIAEELGFKNQNYFSAVFKKNTGLSPRNWLKRKL